MPVPHLRTLIAALLVAYSLAGPAAAQDGAAVLAAPPQSARVYARDGSPIADLGPEERTVVALDSLPAYLPRAFVAAAGDSAALIGRLAARLHLGAGRTEWTAALERRYGRKRLLGEELNRVDFGGGRFGVETVARRWFGKPAARLSLAEAALLAVVAERPDSLAPREHPERARQARDRLLARMEQTGAISPAEAAAARRRPLGLAPNDGWSTRPRYAIEQVRHFLQQRYGDGYGRRGLQVWTTLDPEVQTAADSALAAGLRRAERSPGYTAPRYGAPDAGPTPSGTPYLQGMIVSLDARTGEILAVIGGRDFGDSHFNRATGARRQPGSAWKPLLYSAALERGLTPATLVQDTALRIPLRSGVYAPRNSDARFRGPLTLRRALRESVNTVAVQLALGVGLDSLQSVARRFGLSTPVPPFPASAIGAAEVQPLELVAAYTAFANGGVRAEPHLIQRVADAAGTVLWEAETDTVRVLAPGVAFLMTELLRDAAERGTGVEARARLPERIPMAGKTGTTDGAADLWYIGFTPEVVTGVWVGFDSPKPVAEDASGGTVAAPIWGEMMRRVYRGRPAPAAWSPPPGVIAVAVDSAGQPLTTRCPAAPARREFLLRGTEPTGACVVRSNGAPATEP